MSYSNNIRHKYKAISAFKEVENPEEWFECPNCKLKPLVWEFNNGRHTACGCGKGQYDHFSVRAESVMSVISRSQTGKSAMEYDVHELRDNWNHWVVTGEVIFGKEEIKNGKW